MERSLLIGCGTNHTKQVLPDGKPEWAGALTTMDMNPNCGADIIWNMESRPLPFEDSTFIEIGAYNCLEHWGRQGDWRAWFDEMAEYHRILKPGGVMGIVVPIGPDALADPGHTRFFHSNHFGFLSQAFYERNEVKKSCFSDYRWYWNLDFDVIYLEEVGGHHLAAALRKV
jgi:SAM-dependent methyltransferase